MKIRFPFRVLEGFLFVSLASTLWLVSCQSKLIYFPQPYPPGTVGSWEQRTNGLTLEFQTSEGKQQAYLQGSLITPRNLWIVCGGNATVALDWSEWLLANAPVEDAWLLVDLPGYGTCEGKPNPERILESFETILPIARKKVGLMDAGHDDRLRFFGHSLGAAAVLSAAASSGIDRGVILAPFTSTMDMAKVMTGLPLGFMVRHRFDNTARIDEITRKDDAQILIVHGTADSVIPVSMGRILAHGRGPKVQLTEVPGGGHNDISQTHPEVLATAIAMIGQN